MRRLAEPNHTAVWTGSEMIVWGGYGENGTPMNSGGKYNPATDSWTPVSDGDARQQRSIHTAIWTGSEMIVWGGTHRGNNLQTGGRYNPATDSWSPITLANAAQRP